MLTAAELKMGFELVLNHGFGSVNNKEQNVCLSTATVTFYHAASVYKYTCSVNLNQLYQFVIAVVSLFFLSKVIVKPLSH